VNQELAPLHGHVWDKCRQPCPRPGICMICDGGLSVCVTCGAYEGGLATECPGPQTVDFKLGIYVDALVYAGMIDFRDGWWVPLVSV
jgi:hypothetical protein